MPRPRPASTLVALIVSCLALLGLVDTIEAAPRPLSVAERRAVELASVLFADGPRALWPQLAPSAPWRRLGADAAVAEITVRVGPTRGSTWTLRTPDPQLGDHVAIFAVEFPSGLDETLVFEMVDHGGRQLLQRIRCLAEPIEGPPVRLAGLRAAREALTGARRADPEPLLRRASGNAAVDPVRHAWGAQYRLQRGELASVATLLESLSAESSPLVLLLRARLAQARDQASAPHHFDQARAVGFPHDGLGIEATSAVDQLDVSEWALRYRFLADRGSRDADVYYLLARAAVYEGDSSDRDFATAWELEPMVRADLFADPLLAHAATSPSNLVLVEPGSASEPRPLVRSVRPVVLPAVARAHRLGSSLEVEIGDGSIRVPGGGSVAPSNAVAEDADSRRRRRTAEALALVPSLSETAGTADALALPTVRRQVERAAEALIHERRFDDVLHLTRGVAQRPGVAGSILGPLRGRALVEMGRDAEARDLMVELVKSSGSTGKADPMPLLQLAELCAQHGRYDLAVRLLRRVQAKTSLPGLDARIRQFQLDIELEASYERFVTRHFDLRYPKTTEKRHAILVAALLEAERGRLGRWIPLTDGGERIEVHLFPIDAFMNAYSQGVEVLGLYDGRLRLPFADMAGLHPLVGSVITHELAHAMIAEATNDRAPGWFHEALAQHVEPEQAVANPIPDLEERGSLLAFPLLEAVLDGFAEPQFVGLAYNEALWVAHYIEASRGEAGLHRLLDAFRDGLDTRGALRRVFGQTPAEFDRAFRHWANTDAPLAWPVEEPDYSDRILAEVAEAVPDLEEVMPEEEEDQRPKLAYEAETVEQKEAEHWKLWHAYYASAVRPTKVALRPVIDLIRKQQGSGRIENHCRKLASELATLMSDEAVFTAPDPAVNNALRSAYGHFSRAAGACRQRRFNVVDRELDAALARLGVAAKRLAPHGFKP